MGLFKADFYRFFALGFAGGVLLVLGTMAHDRDASLSQRLVPSAEAAQSH